MQDLCANVYIYIYVWPVSFLVLVILDRLFEEHGKLFQYPRRERGRQYERQCENVKVFGSSICSGVTLENYIIFVAFLSVLNLIYSGHFQR